MPAVSCTRQLKKLRYVDYCQVRSYDEAAGGSFFRSLNFSNTAADPDAMAEQALGSASYAGRSKLRPS